MSWRPVGNVICGKEVSLLLIAGCILCKNQESRQSGNYRKMVVIFHRTTSIIAGVIISIGIQNCCRIRASSLSHYGLFCLALSCVFAYHFFEEMVRLKGIEPPLCHQKRILNPSRLPVPPQPHILWMLGNIVMVFSVGKQNIASFGRYLTINLFCHGDWRIMSVGAGDVM